MKGDYQNPLKKLTFFLSNPVPFNGQRYKKEKGLGTSDSHSSGYEISSQKFFTLLLIYHQTKFDELHLQIYASQFMTS